MKIVFPPRTINETITLFQASEIAQNVYDIESLTIYKNE